MPYDKTKPLKPLKWYKELAEVKGRREAGVFLVEGEGAIRQIAQNRPGDILQIISVFPQPESLRSYSFRQIKVEELRYVCRTKTPQGIVALVRLPAEAYSDALPEKIGSRVLLLEDIQDPGNVGTLIRTAAAFDFDGVLLSEKSADPFSPKVIQSTAGSVLSVWIRRSIEFPEMVQALKQKGFAVFSADLDGESEPSSLANKEKLVLALGNEAAGISKILRQMSDYRVHIPIEREKAESLNVAVCGGILMYLANSKYKNQNG